MLATDILAAHHFNHDETVTIVSCFRFFFSERQMGEKKNLTYNTLLWIEASLNRGQDLDFLGVIAQYDLRLSRALVVSGPAPVSLTNPI